MATRQEIQIALDIIRFANNINDLFDCLSWQLQGIDPSNGGLFEITVSGGMGEPEVRREPTVDEMKTITTRTLSNMRGYRRDVKDYIDKGNLPKIVSGLNALGVDKAQFQQEVEDMRTAYDVVQNNVGAITTKAELAQLGQWIDNNVPKLELVRRSWAL